MIREPSAESANRPSGLFDEPTAPAKHVRIKRMPAIANEIPFMQRPTCTIKEACKAAGLGRTKLYELIKHGTLKTSTVGRRRLVLVPSLLKSVKFRDTSD